MYILLPDHRNRRELLEKVTGGAEFPVSFCKTRWCEIEKLPKGAAAM